MSHAHTHPKRKAGVMSISFAELVHQKKKKGHIVGKWGGIYGL